MADANIIVSAILFPKSNVSKVLYHIIENHNLVLCKYIIDEIIDVFNEKFQQKITEMEKFINETPYELFTLKKICSEKHIKIRDKDDLPVIINAIESKVDLFITGDKDFDEINVEKPIIVKPGKYLEKYIKAIN